MPTESVLDEAQFLSTLDRGTAAVHAQLFIDVLDVGANGVPRDDELVRDLRGGQVGGQELQYLPLALAEGFDQRATWRPLRRGLLSS